MDNTNNKMLISFATRWRLNGDLLECRSCGRSLIASRDGEPMLHRAGCKGSSHPGRALRSALSLTDSKQ